MMMMSDGDNGDDINNTLLNLSSLQVIYSLNSSYSQTYSGWTLLFLSKSYCNWNPENVNNKRQIKFKFTFSDYWPWSPCFTITLQFFRQDLLPNCGCAQVYLKGKELCVYVTWQKLP